MKSSYKQRIERSYHNSLRYDSFVDFIQPNEDFDQRQIQILEIQVIWMIFDLDDF